jgi:hypothetical protein
MHSSATSTPGHIRSNSGNIMFEPFVRLSEISSSRTPGRTTAAKLAWANKSTRAEKSKSNALTVDGLWPWSVKGLHGGEVSGCLAHVSTQLSHAGRDVALLLVEHLQEYIYCRTARQNIESSLSGNRPFQSCEVLCIRSRMRQTAMRMPCESGRHMQLLHASPAGAASDTYLSQLLL